MFLLLRLLLYNIDDFFINVTQPNNKSFVEYNSLKFLYTLKFLFRHKSDLSLSLEK